MRIVRALFAALFGVKRPKPPEPEPSRLYLRPRITGAHSSRMTGFTLVELLIVIAIIAIIAAIAIPNLLAARLNANETAAVATLRTLVSSQAQFAASREADENNNGVGEYGTFAEMSGGVGVRGGALLSPSVLSTSFANVSDGVVQKSGYVYAVYLPDATGTGLPEESTGGADAAVDADLAETVWCAYAWPAVHGQSGKRTFFVTQGGDVTGTATPNYSGTGGAPPSNAGFTGAGDTITGNVAVGMTGRDGNFWTSAG